jgi:hypothetical protein
MRQFLYPCSEVICCDSFEEKGLLASKFVSDSYSDYIDSDGRQHRTVSKSFDGEYSLRQSWTIGDTSAGHLIRRFGRSPVSSESHSDRNFDEIYWRFFQKYPNGTTQFPNKLTRATNFADSNWAQAMIGYVWLSSMNPQFLETDPASGTTADGALATDHCIDFDSFQWLGANQASEAIEVGIWQCIEVHIALNSKTNKNREFDLCIDGFHVVSRKDLNWVG